MMTEPSRNYVKKYLRFADESLTVAEFASSNGLKQSAINRAYYAIFYAASAALLSEQVPLPKTHRTLITIFHRHFIRSGRLEQQFHRQLVKAFQLRQRSDYEIHASMDDNDVVATVEAADAFVQEMRRVIEAS